MVATDVSGLPVGSVPLKVGPVVCSETSKAAYACCVAFEKDEDHVCTSAEA